MKQSIDSMSQKDLIKLKNEIEVKLLSDKEIERKKMFECEDFKQAVFLRDLLFAKAYDSINYKVDYKNELQLEVFFRFLDIRESDLDKIKNDFIGYFSAHILPKKPVNMFEKHLRRTLIDTDYSSEKTSILPREYWHAKMLDFKSRLDKFTMLVKKLELKYIDADMYDEILKFRNNFRESVHRR